ncbi:MAG: alpha-glucosidase/alpha-galactosidase [Candidatus Sumerlaeia bacterium]|nr:alpha-glucosidase/alpha-galactosidase [Candidatus Sumerlaeia bacterium]
MAPKTDEKTKGHSAHTKEAQDSRGLPGRMPRGIKVTMLGAGSSFTIHLVNDFLQIPGLGKLEIALVDIDKKRLKTMEKVVRLLFRQHGVDDSGVTATTERREALKGSDYLVCCVEVSGTECVRHDNDIPLKYGLDQCIGDTLGPGGLFKGLRTIPVWLEILRDAEELCPEALVLNYTNPMAMMCLAAGRASSMQVVGLCHSVQGTSHLLATRAGVPIKELEWECAGVNHLAWFTKLRHKGKDLYPQLIRMAEKDIAGNPVNKDDADDIVRKDMMIHFGAFITESSGHLSEYLPYYRKRKDIMKKYIGPDYHGGSSFYANNWPNWRKGADEEREKIVRGELVWDKPRSWEYAAWIIEAREKDSPFRIHGNVMNKYRGGGPLIDNLRHDGLVEVACMIDRNGINPTAYGRLPEQMAALCNSYLDYVDLAAKAAITKCRETAIHALMLDPLTATVCSPAEIRAMTLELFKAEKKYLPGFK